MRSYAFLSLASGSDIAPGVVESFTIIRQPAGLPLNGYHDRAPVVIWQEDRRRWLTLGHNVMDLLGPESPDRFEVEAVAAVADA